MDKDEKMRRVIEAEPKEEQKQKAAKDEEQKRLKRQRLEDQKKRKDQLQKEQELENLIDARRFKVQELERHPEDERKKEQSWKRNGLKLSGKNKMMKNGKIMMG